MSHTRSHNEGQSTLLSGKHTSYILSHPSLVEMLSWHWRRAADDDDAAGTNRRPHFPRSQFLFFLLSFPLILTSVKSIFFFPRSCIQNSFCVCVCVSHKKQNKTNKKAGWKSKIRNMFFSPVFFFTFFCLLRRRLGDRLTPQLWYDDLYRQLTNWLNTNGRHSIILHRHTPESIVHDRHQCTRVSSIVNFCFVFSFSLTPSVTMYVLNDKRVWSGFACFMYLFFVSRSIVLSIRHFFLLQNSSVWAFEMFKATLPNYLVVTKMYNKVG